MGRAGVSPGAGHCLLVFCPFAGLEPRLAHAPRAGMRPAPLAAGAPRPGFWPPSPKSASTWERAAVGAEAASPARRSAREPRGLRAFRGGPQPGCHVSPPHTPTCSCSGRARWGSPELGEESTGTLLSHPMCFTPGLLHGGFRFVDREPGAGGMESRLPGLCMVAALGRFQQPRLVQNPGAGSGFGTCLGPRRYTVLEQRPLGGLPLRAGVGEFLLGWNLC